MADINNGIKADEVTEILLADGWHIITRGTLAVADNWIWNDDDLPYAREPGRNGFVCTEELNTDGEHMYLAGPLSSILGYRVKTGSASEAP